MTNKKLIDHCNSFWTHNTICSKHCPYNEYCNMFMAKYGETPYLEDEFHEEWYTDEEITDEN